MINQLINTWQYYQEFGMAGAWDILKKGRNNKPFSMRVSGFSEPFYLRNRGADFAMLRGVIGRKELNFPLKHTPKVIVDAGANVGFATRSFLQRFPQAKIVAIEPDADNCSMFSKNVKQPNVILHQAALWGIATGLKISNPDASSCSFQIGESNNESADLVPAITIPELLEKYGSIDILKIDIEGAELELFKNHPESWLPEIGLIAIEYHERYVPGSYNFIHSIITPFCQREIVFGEYRVYDLQGYLI